MAKSIYPHKTFKTAEEVEAAIKSYSEEMRVPYTIRHSRTIDWYNDRQSKHQLDPDLKWKELTVACKHFGEPRFHQHKEGTKRRPNQR